MDFHLYLKHIQKDATISNAGDVGNLFDITSTPPSVITSVCSNYADLYPSAVT
jgi:hypothetical protein